MPSELCLLLCYAMLFNDCFKAKNKIQKTYRLTYAVGIYKNPSMMFTIQILYYNVQKEDILSIFTRAKKRQHPYIKGNL